MREQQRPYLSYLMRLWQARSEGEGVWRASLEDAHSGECVGFGSLEDMFEFLEQQTTDALSDLSPEDQRENGRQAAAVPE